MDAYLQILHCENMMNSIDKKQCEEMNINNMLNDIKQKSMQLRYNVNVALSRTEKLFDVTVKNIK